MSTTASLNGHHPRKQLSDQLDRLDGILDVLGDGITSTVSDAMKNGARVAVKEALVEILTNGEFLAAIRSVTPASRLGRHANVVGSVESESTPPPAASAPGLWSRIKSKHATVRSNVRTALIRAKTRIVNSTMRMRIAVLSVYRRTRQAVFGRVIAVKRIVSTSHAIGLFVKNLKRLAVMTVGVVTLVGILSLVAPQLFAAFASGLTAALTVMGMQKGIQIPGLVSQVITKPQKRNV